LALSLLLGATDDKLLAPVGSVVSIKVKTTDRYRRTVAEVYRNGRSVNLTMVSSGEAFA
jgi:endonuclease YncB( thermonuclease family)